MSYRDGRKLSGTFRAPGTALADVGKVHTFLTELVARIGMTSLGYHLYDVPLAVKRLGQDPLADEGGVTGVAVLSTSHAAIHTWPEECGARLDVDSCRTFERETVEALLEEVFGAYEIRLVDCSDAFVELAAAPVATAEAYA